MGNCCESETAAEVVTAAVAEAEELGFEEPVVAEARHFSNPASDAGATETKVSQPVSVVPELKKDTPTGYMSSEYLATVSAIGKGAYLMYDALQGGKFEIHYRAEPPKEGTIEKKIVLFGEFVEGVTSIADRRFRRNETEVTKTHITQNPTYVYLGIAEFVMLCLRRHMRLKMVMDGKGLPRDYKLYLHLEDLNLRQIRPEEPTIDLSKVPFTHVVVLPYKNTLLEDSASFSQMDLKNRVQRAGGVYQSVED